MLSVPKITGKPILTGEESEHRQAVSTYVLPGEEMESKVSQVYRRLFGPVLSTPELEVLDAKGEVTTRRVAELMPPQLPDLFEGDQLVLLGQYKCDLPLRLQFAGDFRGEHKTFQFKFKLDKAANKNSFVPRLWASPKIGMLIDEIRQAGAASGDDRSVIAQGLERVEILAFTGWPALLVRSATSPSQPGRSSATSQPT